MSRDYYKVETDLIDVRTGRRFKKFLSKRQAENLPIHICYPYEYEDRKKLWEQIKKVS